MLECALKLAAAALPCLSRQAWFPEHRFLLHFAQLYSILTAVVGHVTSSFPHGFSDLMSLKSLSNSSKYNSVINHNMTVKNAKSSWMSMSTSHRYLLVKIIFLGMYVRWRPYLYFFTRNDDVVHFVYHLQYVTRHVIGRNIMTHRIFANEM